MSENSLTSIPFPEIPLPIEELTKPDDVTPNTDFDKSMDPNASQIKDLANLPPGKAIHNLANLDVDQNSQGEKEKYSQWKEDLAKKREAAKQDPLYKKVYQRQYSKHKSFFDEGFGLLSLEGTAMHIYEKAKLSQEKGMDDDTAITNAEGAKAQINKPQKAEKPIAKEASEDKKPSLFNRALAYSRAKVREYIPALEFAKQSAR